MPALKNVKQERFAQLVASGLTASEAFRQVSGKQRSGDGVMGCRWLKRVQPRLNELTEKAEKVEEAATERLIEVKATAVADTVARIVGKALTEAEMLAFLAQVVATPIGQLDGASILTHSLETTGSTGPEAKDLPVSKIKAHDKLRAIELSAKLQGFLIEKVEQTVDDKRVLAPERRAELLRASIERRAHARN